MKRLILVSLPIAALLAFSAGIVMNNIILLAASVALALAAFLADKRFQEYFDITEFKK